MTCLRSYAGFPLTTSVCIAASACCDKHWPLHGEPVKIAQSITPTMQVYDRCTRASEQQLLRVLAIKTEAGRRSCIAYILYMTRTYSITRTTSSCIYKATTACNAMPAPVREGSNRVLNPRRHRPIRILSRHRGGGGGRPPCRLTPD